MISLGWLALVRLVSVCTGYHPAVSLPFPRGGRYEIAESRLMRAIDGRVMHAAVDNSYFMPVYGNITHNPRNFFSWAYLSNRIRCPSAAGSVCSDNRVVHGQTIGRITYFDKYTSVISGRAANIFEIEGGTELGSGLSAKRKVYPIAGRKIGGDYDSAGRLYVATLHRRRLNSGGCCLLSQGYGLPVGFAHLLPQQTNLCSRIIGQSSGLLGQIAQPTNGVLKIASVVGIPVSQTRNDDPYGGAMLTTDITGVLDSAPVSVT